MSAVPLVLVICELTIFCLAAVSVAYVLVFAIAALLPRRRHETATDVTARFLIVIPAYAEDNVIMPTVKAALTQTYADVDVCVVTDHMTEATNSRLAALPLRLVRAAYADSTKGKALQLAMTEAYDRRRHTHILIIDADNIIQPDLCQQLAALCTTSRVAIQLHRCAKNTDTPIAMLDAASEEVNNSLFRRGHNNIGLTSALIGSGICFEATWLEHAVQSLKTAGEDKELERQLLLEGHRTIFADELYVFDEKVNNRVNFGRQRRRWLAAQLWALGFMLQGLPQALRPHSQALRIDYLDKTLQQALIPRSLLMALTAFMLALTLTLSLAGIMPWATFIRWMALTAALYVAILTAIPRSMRGTKLARATAALPQLLGQMVMSLFRLRGASHKFLHTEHGQS